MLSDAKSIAYFIDGEVQEKSRVRDPRAHEVMRLSDIVAAVEKWVENDQSQACICVDENRISAVLDDDHLGVNTCEMVLGETEAFDRVKGFIGGQNFDQVELIRLLRNELRGASPSLLAAVRNLKFTRTENGQSNMQHGNESLGRSIEAAVTVADKIDESFVVETKCYKGIDELKTYSFLVTIEVNIQKQMFTLRSQADEVDEAVLDSITTIAEILADNLDGATVMLGQYRVPK